MDVVRIGEEIDAVKKGLRGLKRSIQICANGAATLPDVNRELMNADPEYDALHFIGHGSETDDILYFEGECGIAREVPPVEIADVIGGRVKLLVVMSCFSGKVVDKLFPKKGKPAVPAAVCIREDHPIEVRAAELFTGALYSGLSRGKTLRESFDDALKVVRLDGKVGENAMPHTDIKPTPWRRFMLKGDENLTFPESPRGDPEINDLITPGPHIKIRRTDELFVGRKADIVATAQLLEPPQLGTNERKARIVTLYGEGGIGKTRLAEATAEWLAFRGKFPGGIFEVACEGLNSAPELALAILQAMRAVQGENVPQPELVLQQYMMTLEKRTLLVLDNLDGLFSPEAKSGEAGGLLKNCITASSCLNILATCRWSLELGSDERAFHIDPMIPSDAVELFISSIPDVDIQSELRGMTYGQQIGVFQQIYKLQIYKLTAGIPLCVILAARRLIRHGENVGTLLKNAADELLEVMESSELRDRPERLRSLRASLKLSYDYLSEPARGLFARMSFFPGGLSRKLDLWELLGENWKELAEGEITRYALARYDRDTDRYSMLHPVQEYAREKLDAGTADEFRRKAAEFWADFARWHDLQMDVRPSAQKSLEQLIKLSDDPEERGRQREALRSNAFLAMKAEEANLTHAAEWAMKAGEETGLGMVDSMMDYLNLSAGWYTKERLYRSALELRRKLAESNPEEYLPDVAMTLNNMGNLHDDMGHPDEAMGCYQEAIGIRWEFFRKYPSAQAGEMLKVLRNAMDLYEKLGMKEKARECQEMMEAIRGRLFEN
jgi:predicted ATPase